MNKTTIQNLATFSLMAATIIVLVGCMAPIAEESLNLPKTESLVEINFGNITYNFVCISDRSNLTYNVTHPAFIESYGKSLNNVQINNTLYRIFRDDIKANPQIDSFSPKLLNITDEIVFCRGVMSKKQSITISTHDQLNKKQIAYRYPEEALVECHMKKDISYCGVNGDLLVSDILKGTMNAVKKIHEG